VSPRSWRRHRIVWLAAHRAEVYPLTIAAEERRSRLADGGIVTHGCIIEHARAAIRNQSERGVPGRARCRQAPPCSGFAAELSARLAARGARGVRHPCKIAAGSGRKFVRTRGTERRPFAIQAAVLQTGLAGRRTIGKLASLLRAGSACQCLLSGATHQSHRQYSQSCPPRIVLLHFYSSSFS
jgi:hypothetical protein